jgi:hypothetical protein
MTVNNSHFLRIWIPLQTQNDNDKYLAEDMCLEWQLAWSLQIGVRSCLRKVVKAWIPKSRLVPALSPYEDF